MKRTANIAAFALAATAIMTPFAAPTARAGLMDGLVDGLNEGLKKAGDAVTEATGVQPTQPIDPNKEVVARGIFQGVGEFVCFKGELKKPPTKIVDYGSNPELFGTGGSGATLGKGNFVISGTALANGVSAGVPCEVAIKEGTMKLVVAGGPQGTGQRIRTTREVINVQCAWPGQGKETWGFEDKNSPDYMVKICTGNSPSNPAFGMPEVRYNLNTKRFSPLTREDVSMLPKEMAEKLFQRSIGIAEKTNAEIVATEAAPPKRTVVPAQPENTFRPY